MPHYYDSDPNTESNRKNIAYRMNGINFDFVSDTNVFSRSEIDFGSNLMIEEMVKDIKAAEKKPQTFLDLGCGYGVVGIVMNSVFMGMTVTGVDVNARAVGLANENAKSNGVRASFIQSDGLAQIPEDQLYDAIATNPPVRAGKKTVFRFYEESFAHLNKGGAIYVVLQRKQGAPSTEAKLKELFGNCEVLGIDGGYRVMKSVKE